MALPHFYLKDQFITNQHREGFALELSEDDSKHARVLRLAPGEHLAVIDAQNDYFECEVVSFKGALMVKISSHFRGMNDTFPRVVLAQGLAKSDKLEMVIRHATELGVKRFIPFTSERSVMKLDEKRAAKKHDRWNTIAKSAAMQSGQPEIPEVSNLCSLTDLPHVLGEVDALLICWEECPQSASFKAALAGITQLHDHPITVALVVGPEGGLSEREVGYLLDNDPRAALISLGPSILRAETAGIVAPALVVYELGGFEQSHFFDRAEHEQV